MADVTPSPTHVDTLDEDNCRLITWTPLTAANEAGTAVSMGAYADRTIQFSGTWDSATAVLQGSNNGTTWFTLTDPQGNAISKTADGIEAVSEMTRYVRPSTSGGGASQSVSALLFVRKVV